MILVKLLILLLVPVLLILPFLPIRWIFSFSYYAAPNVTRRRNLINILLMAALALACAILMPELRKLAVWVGSLKPVVWVLSRIPVYAQYAAELAIIIFVNFLYCFAAFLILLIIRGGEKIIDLIKGVGKGIKSGRAKLRKKLNDADQPRKKRRRKKQDPEEPEGFPRKLLPEPEEPVTGNRILFPGALTEKKPRRERKKRTSAQEEPPAEPTGLAKLVQAVCGVFYETVEDQWYVRPQTRHVAKHLRNFLCLVGAMYAIVFFLLLIPALFHVTVLENLLYRLLQFFLTVNYLYPTLALAVLVLSWKILDGKPVPVTPTDPEEDPEQRQKGRIVDLDQVEANLMKVCGKDYEVQSFYSSDVVSNAADRTTVDLSENDLLRSIAQYVKSEGLELNQEYLLGVKSFLDGKNVLFHAPLYTAVGAYLYAALNLRIMQGERMVVICHNRSQIPNYIEQMNEGFMSLTRTHKPLWKIVTREGLGRDAEEDILVLTPEDFRDERLFASAEAFFRQVTVALLPDANQIVSANNYYCQVISQRLYQLCSRDLQYIFLSTRTTLNLDNALTEFFVLDSKPVYARGDYSYGDVHIYVWRVKKDGAVVLDNAAQTMPLEVCISDIANQFGITEPNLVSDSAIYSNQINMRWLDIYDAAKKPLGFAIVSDDSYNLPSVIHAYSRYIGKKASVLHVISRQYLLQNYFYAHATRYLFEQPLLERSMVEHAKPEKTRAVLLLCRLMEGIPVDDFILEMKQHLGCDGDADASNFEDISDLVDRCLEYALGSKPDSGQAHFTLYQPKNVFYPQRYIRIQENYDVLSHLMEETQLIQLRFSGSARQSVYINLFRRMIDQRYLTGQNLVFANQNYEIKRIDRANGIIEVDDASSVHGLARDYVQLRDYQLLTGAFAEICRKDEPASDSVDASLHQMRKEFIGEESIVNAIVMAQSETSFRVCSDTYGYYMVHTDGRSLHVTDSNIPVIRLNEATRSELRREVTGGVYLRLELKRSRDDRLTMTLAALLQEMMKTLFPDCYFCLSVCPILARPEAIYQNQDFKSRTIAQFYPRLENWGAVRPNSIELLIVDDCEGGTGAMNLLFEPEGTFLQNVLWMLSDYLDWQKENEPSPYIFFGMETQPEIFDLDGTRAILRSFARSYVREHDIHSQLEPANRCKLCGQRIDEPYLWHGKHMICADCSEEYTPDADEAAKILDYARQYLIDTFSIELPELTIQVEPQLPEDALSALDLDAGIIRLTEDLPLRTMHVQIMTQLVRCWQLTHLDIDGDIRIDGQPLYVNLQYLRFLQQFQYAQVLHREYLLGQDDASRGYCQLLQALQAEGHDNSFLYLLQQRRQRGVTPIKKPVVKKSTRIPQDKKVPRYFRTTLSPEEAAIYDAIFDCYMNQDAELDLRSYALRDETLERIHTCVFYDHPEIFWSNRTYQWQTTDDGQVTTLIPLYTATREARESLQKEIDDAVAPFLKDVSEDMGDYDLALKLYETVIGFLDYDSIALERQSHQSVEERLDKMDNLRNIYGALVQHKSVCAGYAKAYQYLLQTMGVEALYVTGDCFSGGRHAWNIVRLEGDYYQMDVTWGDYSNTDPSKDRNGLSFAYFAVTDEQIQRSRSIDTEPTLPKCTSDNCNYYVRNGLYFTRYDPASVREVLAEKLRDPNTAFVELRFSNAKLLHDAEYFLCMNGGVAEALRAAGREVGSCTSSIREDLCLLRINFE